MTTEKSQDDKNELHGEALLWRYARWNKDEDEEHTPGCPCCLQENR
ncbi:MAG: MerR family transcriptional regulator [Cardiobacteriaceae bacterium]|nr:MerR family transcriptional regulator [Cardiobacteriaceae bacterium]